MEQIMPGLRLDIVTIERSVYSGEADLVLAPGVMGQLGILPRHAPLIARLMAGELVVRKDGHDEVYAIGGGLLEVLPDRVTVLADSAEMAREINVQRAEAARARAAERLRGAAGRVQLSRAEAALRRSLTRLRVARRRAPLGRGGGGESTAGDD
jgi:F-type H+-transporting ATPase subunit epsilon